MERVLGTPALFATAYVNVGSSIYQVSDEGRGIPAALVQRRQ